MLVLSRKVGETILIGENIRVTIIEIGGGSRVRLGVDAPQDVDIRREELDPLSHCDHCGKRLLNGQRTSDSNVCSSCVSKSR